ncbi:MAG: diacylglycerol kinase family protein [Patescibacteria group bacterium]|jgi:diacylglycerol kinase|nr:diacylglycerol kinase family protein [Patescibacteria group bacterium]
MIKIRRLFKSFKYAVNGLIKIFKEEQNLRIQFFLGLLALSLAWFYRIDKIELLLIVFSIGLVLLMETINSAVERVADVLKPRINTYVKEIKDITAAAVMLASIISLIIGISIFWPYLIDTL